MAKTNGFESATKGRTVRSYSERNGGSIYNYQALKKAFELAEQEALEIDKELRKYEEEMKIST